METVLQIVLGFVWWIIGLPIVCLAATPFILAVSCIGRGSYWHQVRRRYRGLIDFWKEYGMLIVP